MLIGVEITDVIFAVDSIPAIFGITRDPFIVYTSNICAILGLRSLYFLLAGVMDLFIYLQTGLAVILSFVGIKMLINDIYHVPTAASLGFIVLVLALSIGLLILAAILGVLIASRIYRIGVLMYGQKPSFREVFRNRKLLGTSR